MVHETARTQGKTQSHKRIFKLRFDIIFRILISTRLSHRRPERRYKVVFPSDESVYDQGEGEGGHVLKPGGVLRLFFLTRQLLIPCTVVFGREFGSSEHRIYRQNPYIFFLNMAYLLFHSTAQNGFPLSGTEVCNIFLNEEPNLTQTSI